MPASQQARSEGMRMGQETQTVEGFERLRSQSGQPVVT